MCKRSVPSHCFSTQTAMVSAACRAQCSCPCFYVEHSPVPAQADDDLQPVHMLRMYMLSPSLCLHGAFKGFTQWALGDSEHSFVYVCRIAEIELEMSRTQKNKATEYHLGQLKAKLAKLRTELQEGKTKVRSA